MYGLHLNQAEEFLGKSIDDATGEDMIALAEHYSQRYQPATVRNKISTLSSYYTFMMKLGKRKDNPTSLVRYPKIDPNRTVKWLTDSEIDALLAEAGAHPRDLAIVWLALHGLRVGEIVKLRVEQFTGGVLWNVEGKSAESRNIPLVADAQAALRAWIGPRQSGPMFPSRYHKHDSIRRLTVQRYIYNLTQKMGRRVSIHALRHTYGSRAVRRGVNTLALAQLMGHKSPVTTAKYVHLDTEALRASNELVYPSESSLHVIHGGKSVAVEGR